MKVVKFVAQCLVYPFAAAWVLAWAVILFFGPVYLAITMLKNAWRLFQ